ncbi:hypothetical protein PR048_017290 [Dryococelus australis]|uniref:Uncharacterized protein n=1 Tax=Dryococelus australis TaxID=614101 RepID=A0ABQ9H941_9NEOP|nr:hypothetical protein PR048_017290 [Dryococelus australis]
MMVAEVSMEQRRNEVTGETGDTRENPRTNGIVRIVVGKENRKEACLPNVSSVLGWSLTVAVFHLASEIPGRVCLVSCDSLAQVASRVQSPAGSQDFRKWESCRTMPFVGGFSRRSPVSPTPSFRRRSILTSIALTGSQDLAVKEPPKSLHSLTSANVMAEKEFNVGTQRLVVRSQRDRSPSSLVYGHTPVFFNDHVEQSRYNQQPITELLIADNGGVIHNSVRRVEGDQYS